MKIESSFNWKLTDENEDLDITRPILMPDIYAPKEDTDETGTGKWYGFNPYDTAVRLKK